MSYYFTGKPCPKGHVAERRVLNYVCRECEREQARDFYHEHRDKAVAMQKRWRAATPEYQAARMRKWRSRNTVAIQNYMRVWRKENASQEAAKKKLWAIQNAGRKNASTAKRHAAKMQRTPAWLTADDLWLMQEAYTLARLRNDVTDILWHVDHIVPLQGESVSGLHVPWNLRVIPAIENMSKGNRTI